MTDWQLTITKQGSIQLVLQMGYSFYFTRDLPTVTQTISQFALNPAFVTLVRFRSRKTKDHSNKSAIKEWEYWFWALGCGYAILFNSLQCLNLNLIPASLFHFFIFTLTTTRAQSQPRSA